MKDLTAIHRARLRLSDAAVRVRRLDEALRLAEKELREAGAALDELEGVD